MSLEEITIENSVETWNIVKILLYAIFTFIYAFFGIIALVVTIVYPAPTPKTDLYFVIVWVSILAYTALMFFRNFIIKRIFVRIAPHIFIEFTYALERISKILLISFGLSFFLLIAVPIEIFDSQRIFFTIFSFCLLYIPFFSFSYAISVSGEIRIIFNELVLNLNNFDKRQKWLKRFFEKLKGKMKKGNMKVTTDKLIYYSNMKLLNSEEIQKNLRELGRWMLGEKIENVMNSIHMIIPENEIKPITKKPILDRFYQIPPDVRKYLVLAITLIVVLLLKPELVEKLIELI